MATPDPDPVPDAGEPEPGTETKGTRPSLTVPMILAFAAFLIFVAWAAFPNNGKVKITTQEYHQLRDLVLVLIAALLPSDAIIRVGRSRLFRKIPKADEAAKYAPPTTLAQILAFATYLVVAGAMVVGDDWVDSGELQQIIDVAQILIAALLPSDAVIRVARALHLASLPTPPTQKQLKKV